MLDLCVGAHKTELSNIVFIVVTVNMLLADIIIIIIIIIMGHAVA
jgi:hypothetical protein